jgi:flagellum-specific peptidoglycan hydrolase FlgJ
MKTLLIILMSFSSNNELTPKNVYAYCIEQEVQHPEIVTAQAIWETGWFKCKDCSLDKNNLFGFNTGGPYFKYTNWKESIDAYKRWQDTYYDSTRDYYKFLACIYKDRNGRCLKYCTNPDSYNNCLKATILKHENTWKSN